MFDMKTLFKMLFALLIGACGSITFIYLHIPLPWLLGAIFATSIAIRFEKLPISSPTTFSPPARVLIGLTLGSAFTPQILKYIDVYFYSLLLVIPFTILTAICGTYYYHKLLNYDIKTAFLGSVPGGVIEMAIIGQDIKANISKIALMQSSRVFFVVVSLPFIIQYIFHINISGNRLITTPIVNVDPYQLTILIILGFVAGFIAKRVKLAAAYLIGPLIISAIVHSTGLLSVHIPDEFLKCMQIIFGTIIGFAFKGVDLKTLMKTFLYSFGHFIVLMILCAIFIFIAYKLFDFDALSILLAFGPGGQTEINLIAILVGANLPYITLSHIARLCIVMNIAPIIARRMYKKESLK